jgi:hypothetical protein
MINGYLRGRTYIYSVRGSLIHEEFLILNSSLLFCLTCCFLWLLLVLWFFLLLDDIVKVFLPFWSSSCASKPTATVW